VSCLFLLNSCFISLSSNYRQACAKHSHAGIVFIQWSKNRFFAPQGRHIAPINMKFGSPPAESLVPNFTFIRAEMWEYIPKTVEISKFGHKFLPLRGHLFAQFL